MTRAVFFGMLVITACRTPPSSTGDVVAIGNPQRRLDTVSKVRAHQYDSHLNKLDRAAILAMRMEDALAQGGTLSAERAYDLAVSAKFSFADYVPANGTNPAIILVTNGGGPAVQTVSVLAVSSDSRYAETWLETRLVEGDELLHKVPRDPAVEEELKRRVSQLQLLPLLLPPDQQGH